MLNFLNSIGKAAGSAMAPALPPSFNLFEYDDDTHYWDYRNGSGSNTIDPSLGINTLSSSVDAIHGELALVQPNKALQPLWTSGQGIDFNDATARQMTFNDISTIAKGHGYYMAFNAKFTTAGNSCILAITRNGSTNQSRGVSYLTSSRYFGWKGTNNDGTAAIAFWGYGSVQIPLNTWVTVELSIIADGVTTNPLKVWINGVLQTLTSENAAAFTIPNTSPSEVIFGNQVSDTESMDGKIVHFAFRNANTGVNDPIRISISTYLNAERAGL